MKLFLNKQNCVLTRSAYTKGHKKVLAHYLEHFQLKQKETAALDSTVIYSSYVWDWLYVLTEEYSEARKEPFPPTKWLSSDQSLLFALLS